jgi:hypothetical protein
VKGKLFGPVPVALIRRRGLGTVQAERIHCTGAILRVERVRVLRKQRGIEAIDGRRVWCCEERWLGGRILGNRVRTEIVIEGDILGEDDHQMPDGRHGIGRALS